MPGFRLVAGFGGSLSGKMTEGQRENSLSETHLKTSPLASFHARHDGKLVAFAGWSLPLQYARAGILAEHAQTREAASLFDVSHMCQLRVSGAGRQEAINRTLPIAAENLGPGRNKYSFACNSSGGVLDDLLIGNDGDSFFIICNASRAEVMEAHLRRELGSDAKLSKITDHALLAIQGPGASEVVEQIFPAAQDLYFMDSKYVEIEGLRCRVARGGYTGEDGFEIAVPAEGAEQLASLLVGDASACEPAGLGARDTLRLEACLCLYGNDLSEEISPVEARLTWAIPPSVRRNGGFIGAERVLSQIADGSSRKLVALQVSGNAPVRAGAALQVAGNQVGVVTSGAFSPTLRKPIALALVASEHAAIGVELSAELRGREISCTVQKMPFVPHKYKVRPKKSKPSQKGGCQ